jgi:hypothetical protein
MVECFLHKTQFERLGKRGTQQEKQRQTARQRLSKTTVAKTVAKKRTKPSPLETRFPLLALAPNFEGRPDMLPCTHGEVCKLFRQRWFVIIIFFMIFHDKFMFFFMMKTSKCHIFTPRHPRVEIQADYMSAEPADSTYADFKPIGAFSPPRFYDFL